MGLSVYFPAYKHWQGQHPYSQIIYLPRLQTSSYYVAIVLVCALQLHHHSHLHEKEVFMPEHLGHHTSRPILEVQGHNNMYIHT